MLGKLEELVLLSLLRGGSDTGAGDIQARITEVQGKEQAFGSVFTTLDRLSAKGFVESRKGKPDPRRGGRAPRLYTITGAGRAALDKSMNVTRRAAEGVQWGYPEAAR